MADVASRVAGSAVPGGAAPGGPIGHTGPRPYEMALKAANLVSRGSSAHEIDVLSRGIEMVQAAADADLGCLHEPGRDWAACGGVYGRRPPVPVVPRLAGRTYFVAPELVARYQHSLGRAAGKLQAPRFQPGCETLSMREREVLRLVARGLSNGAAASALDLSEHTVKRHVANILMKLDLPTRAAAVAHAFRAGLL